METKKKLVSLLSKLDPRFALLIPLVLICGLGSWYEGLIPPPQTYQLKIIGQNCGTVYTSGVNSAQTDDADDGEQCLWNAYSSCQTATLEIVESSVDAGRDFSVATQKRGAKCETSLTVIYWSQTRLPFFPFKESRETHQCAGLQQWMGGLQVTRCGSFGDVRIPPRPSNQVGHVCGSVWYDGQDVLSASDLTSEECLWQAYTVCTRPATLLYTIQISGDDTSSGYFAEHTLVAQPERGACVLTDSVTSNAAVLYTCASLTWSTQHNLTAHHCGAEGDVVIGAAPTPTPTTTSTP
jgi:hypothetical protein